VAEVLAGAIWVQDRVRYYDVPLRFS
jgi:hypothetical protein